jgi:predicted deacylase
MVERACFSIAPFSGHYEEAIACGSAVAAGDVVGWLHDFDRIDLDPHPVRAGVDGIVIAQAWDVRVVQGQHIVVTGRVQPWRS